jgi:CO/xanthine dehydrogenase Mo-binding subunit
MFMRWDEIGWGNPDPGMLMDIRAGGDEKSNIVGHSFTQFYPKYVSGPDATLELKLMDAAQRGTYISANHWPGGMYNLPNASYLLKSIPVPEYGVRADWLRAGGSPLAVFGGEQMIDELAHAAKMDPVAFRIQNVVHSDRRERLLAVLNTVTKAANWQAKVAGSNLSSKNVVTGRGVAWTTSSNDPIGQYAKSVDASNTPNGEMAAIADVTVNRKTGKVTVTHIHQAFSSGLMVNPGLVENQMVGGILQIVSRLLTEQYRYSKTQVTSGDFVTYPIMRFKDAPKVTAIVVQRADLPPQGVGEPVTTAVAAAVANAFFDATGVRMRTAPMTPARVRAVLKAGGNGTVGVN